MNINVPSPSVTIPDEINQAIERGKNQVSLMEAEVKRMQNLVNEQKSELVVLATQKSSLESVIESFEVSKKELAKEIPKVQKEVEKEKKELEKLLSKNKENAGVLNDREEDLVEKESLLKQRESILSEKNASLELKATELKDREEAVRAHEEKIKELVSKL